MIIMVQGLDEAFLYTVIEYQLLGTNLGPHLRKEKHNEICMKNVFAYS